MVGLASPQWFPSSGLPAAGWQWPPGTQGAMICQAGTGGCVCHPLPSGASFKLGLNQRHPAQVFLFFPFSLFHVIL